VLGEFRIRLTGNLDAEAEMQFERGRRFFDLLDERFEAGELGRSDMLAALARHCRKMIGGFGN